jgi:release factor glutamine methyltransferase
VHRGTRSTLGAQHEDVGVHSVGQLIDEVATLLRDDAARDAAELVTALLDVPRHWPILNAGKLVDAEVRRRARHAAERRAAGAPLAYAVGRANFRSLTLDVDERVLIPRPETELLVDLVLARARPAGVVVDVGTGSGAIAISLSLEGAFDRVLATDISADALIVARENAGKYEVPNVEFLHGHLLGPTIQATPRRLAAVVSNPPYISFADIADLPPSVRDWEPAVALFSGRSGLGVTAQLVRQAGARLEAGGLLALEVDARRASLVAEMVASDTRFEDVSVHLDLAGRERFVLASRRMEEGEQE